jgi:hypothetical protein
MIYLGITQGSEMHNRFLLLVKAIAYYFSFSSYHPTQRFTQITNCMGRTGAYLNWIPSV